MGHRPPRYWPRPDGRDPSAQVPYLTLFARAGTSREKADADVASLQIHELPSARGCTYVLPASDFALGLKVGQNFGDDMPTARKLGVTDSEIEKLCEAILPALEKRPLEPEALREAVGSAARNLGAEGAKKRLTTTLPVALGKLVAVGTVITDRPPHRPVLAALPHTVLTSDVWRRSAHWDRDVGSERRESARPDIHEISPTSSGCAGSVAGAVAATAAEHHSERP